MKEVKETEEGGEGRRGREEKQEKNIIGGRARRERGGKVKNKQRVKESGLTGGDRMEKEGLGEVCVERWRRTALKKRDEKR